MAGHDDAQFLRADEALGGLYPRHPAGVGPHAGHLALLDDVHAHRRTGPRIAPGHGIMPRRAAARLIEGAQHRIARPVDIDDRHQFLDPVRSDPFGLHALQHVGMHRAQIAPHLVMGLGQHQQAARAEHDVVVQILAERLVQRARLFIKRRRGVLQVVGADDRGVAPGVAAAQPALFDHRDIGDAVVLAEVIGRGQTMAACADDHHVILGLRRGLGPGALPALVVAQRLSGDGESGITCHGRPAPFAGVALLWNGAEFYPLSQAAQSGKMRHGAATRHHGTTGDCTFCLWPPAIT